MTKLLFTNHSHTNRAEKKKLDKESFIPKCLFMKRLIVVHITGSRLKHYHFYETWGEKFVYLQSSEKLHIKSRGLCK